LDKSILLKRSISNSIRTSRYKEKGKVNFKTACFTNNPYPELKFKREIRAGSGAEKFIFESTINSVERVLTMGAQLHIVITGMQRAPQKYE
jgi:hypothetical protein